MLFETDKTYISVAAADDIESIVEKLSLALVFILHKILKIWQIPLVILGLDLIYHFQYTYSGESAIAYYFIEIPFIVFTFLFTIWIYIFSIKNGIDED